MIKRYFKTFKWNSESGKFRIIGFNLFSITHALFFFCCYEVWSSSNFVTWIPENKYMITLLAISSGYAYSIIIDLLFGIGRKSPIFK